MNGKHEYQDEYAANKIILEPFGLWNRENIMGKSFTDN